jgi:VIT1/CCC1 family predicted Fe2+/Mn2+ transporter
MDGLTVLQFAATIVLGLLCLIFLGFVVALAMGTSRTARARHMKAAPDPRSNYYRSRMDI